MELVGIYQALGEETRLRMFHLLTHRPLCVCHFQKILELPQVTISKHLRYLRKRGLATARRHGQWMIYSLPEPAPVELASHGALVNALRRTTPVLAADYRRLSGVKADCEWVYAALNPAKPPRRTRSTQ